MPRNTMLDRELGFLKRVASNAESGAKSARWRRATQRRASRISVVVRSIPSLVVADEFTISKNAGTWTVTSNGEPVFVVCTKTPVRSLEDLGLPVPVRVVHPELVDIERMTRLCARGLISYIK